MEVKPLLVKPVSQPTPSAADGSCASLIVAALSDAAMWAKKKKEGGRLHEV